MQPGTAMAPIKSLRNLMTTDPFFLLQNRLNRLVDFPLAPFVEEAQPLTTWVPPCDIYVIEKEIVLKAELPGLKKEDVFVSIENNVLTIRGEKKAERNGEGKYFTERYYGAFERQIPLYNVQEDKAEASFKNGVLTVSLPKSDKPREGVKRIAIHTQ